MKIIEKSYKWHGRLQKRSRTDYIILHHAALVSCSADDIHRIHVNNNGWAGIGYNFYVRKDGSVYRGRPVDTVGAHCENYNSRSVGVCFEGNFEKETMCDVQRRAGNELVCYLKKLYPGAKVKKHSNFNSTACPGMKFPFDEISKVKAELTVANEIVSELNKRGIVTNAGLWNVKCVADVNAYWLARKLCNMTKKAPDRSPKLESVNDIVWELSHRGIITDKALWLRIMEEDKDLYWLGYKGANMTVNV